MTTVFCAGCLRADRISFFRRAIAKAPAYDAIRHLERIIKAGAIEQPFFQDLMRTPRMKEILNQTYPGVIKLREYAGYTGSRSCKTECRNDLVALRNTRPTQSANPGQLLTLEDLGVWSYN